VRDFRLHPRIIGNPPLGKGPAKGVTLDPDAMAQAFYAAMGWDLATGKPEPARLERLGLNDLLSVLYPRHGPGE